jgi:energy-converting hydrogenase B subunit D
VTVLQGALLVLVAVGGTAVVLVRDPLRQAIVASVYGLLLGLLFFAFQAPDVALSQIVVGSVALPLMIVLTLAKLNRLRGPDRGSDE